MDSTAELIINVRALDYHSVELETNQGNCYRCDLSRFQSVYCYPKKEQWNKVSIDSYGLDLVWPSRFEVHIDQALAEAKILTNAYSQNH